MKRRALRIDNSLYFNTQNCYFADAAPVMPYHIKWIYDIFILNSKALWSVKAAPHDNNLPCLQFVTRVPSFAFGNILAVNAPGTK